jgi:hypothetical protein
MIYIDFAIFNGCVNFNIKAANCIEPGLRLPRCVYYGGWFGTLLCALSAFHLVILSLATIRQSAKQRILEKRCCAACCRDVTWFISQSFILNWATIWHRSNTPHDNAPFSVHCKRQDDKTKVRQRAIWCFVVLLLVPTRRIKAYQISRHSIQPRPGSVQTTFNFKR